MLLVLRCAICEKVEESAQDTEELKDAEPDDVDPLAFICKECSRG